ncbi:MAG: DASS family sodium-coupled anion symporter [Candidatus Marinimicrobia bacterium]|jgi:sodium-dependent dicarboxylate transporter 2/3/5|nr:DASS family sodium-coupled anion symporter [Candidatus Neomarinimicrobiota bacterium]MBT7423341.1 DASS family sodium-coupled anion symporter [Candidatus Neomarinimicrobiota bacterium]MBT7525194.1 DASS family sodium-coupled anion symporter [Candidatus Neomarinimicrobiota bacterium]MDG2366702.1 DASS family sodium-coupled anion symporter [Candidatus Neomarinimicrobiota bacterium]
MSQMSVSKKLIVILLWGIFSYLLSQLLVDVDSTQKGLFILFICAGLWMTEIVPLPVTALLVPVIAYFMGILSPKEAMAPFSSTIIFLFMGGFTLAALLNKHGIDRWLADKVTTMSNGNLWVSVIGFFAVTSFLSMWMSNTATTAMMIPIAIALVNKEYPRMRTMILLGTAYSANIGGNGTAVGSPPNGLAVSALDIDFFTWFKVGFPTALVMFPLVIIALWFVIRPEKDAKVNRLSDSHSMNWTSEAKGTIGLFLFTVICWIFSSQIGASLGLKNFDRMIAILITALAPAFKLITWKDLEDKIGWGILLLFGGGLCLSVVLGETGTSLWLATALINSISTPWIIIFACITLMVFLTELSSNTGSAAILIPVMIALSNQFDPAVTYALVFGVGLAANCAFMLPVATPPNALVYGTGYINQKDMIKTGIILNIFSIFVVYTMVTLLT